MQVTLNLKIVTYLDDNIYSKVPNKLYLDSYLNDCTNALVLRSYYAFSFQGFFFINGNNKKLDIIIFSSCIAFKRKIRAADGKTELALFCRYYKD